MAEEIKFVQSAEPAVVATGRKRGRPRKDESRGPDSAGRRYQRADQGSNSSSIFIGQHVSGVLDGTFDAGYMLTVRVGNTGTVLRGVVFEPGRFVPISSANDIAPHVPMVSRANVSFPGGTEIPNQSVLAKSKIATPTSPSPGAPYAIHGDKASTPLLMSTFVVPVTLSSATHQSQSPPVETFLKLKSDNHPSPLVSVKSVKSDSDSKNIPTGIEPNVVPQSGSADMACQSSTHLNIEEVKETGDEKLIAPLPAITTDAGNTCEAGQTPLVVENRSSDATDASDNADLGLTSADVNPKIS